MSSIRDNSIREIVKDQMRLMAESLTFGIATSDKDQEDSSESSEVMLLYYKEVVKQASRALKKLNNNGIKDTSVNKPRIEKEFKSTTLSLALNHWAAAIARALHPDHKKQDKSLCEDIRKAIREGNIDYFPTHEIEFTLTAGIEGKIGTRTIASAIKDVWLPRFNEIKLGMIDHRIQVKNTENLPEVWGPVHDYEKIYRDKYGSDSTPPVSTKPKNTGEKKTIKQPVIIDNIKSDQDSSDSDEDLTPQVKSTITKGKASASNKDIKGKPKTGSSSKKLKIAAPAGAGAESEGEPGSKLQQRKIIQADSSDDSSSDDD